MIHFSGWIPYTAWTDVTSATATTRKVFHIREMWLHSPRYIGYIYLSIFILCIDYRYHWISPKWCTYHKWLILLMVQNSANRSRLVVYPIIFRVFYIPGGWPGDFWTINRIFKPNMLSWHFLSLHSNIEASKPVSYRLAVLRSPFARRQSIANWVDIDLWSAWNLRIFIVDKFSRVIPQGLPMMGSPLW